MDSFSNYAVVNKDVIVESFVTIGLSNARRASYPADIKFFKN
ncbi:hypothetical protein [Crassaminicella thermophila]|nr:hypothetical protein [Crassaminicella thermophila]